MAIMKMKDARKLGDKDIDKKLSELRLELTKEKANIAIGANAVSPGRIKEIRRAVARLLTVKDERKKAAKQTSSAKNSKKAGEK